VASYRPVLLVQEAVAWQSDGLRFFAFGFRANFAIVSVMRIILPQEENPALREIARDIPLPDIQSKKIQDLIGQMRELLSHEEYGVALAAPQLGESIKLFIVSGRALARDKRNAPDEPGRSDEDVRPLPDQVYINPELLKLSRKKYDKHEGCLSIRGKWGIVPRSEKATVKAYDEEGREFTRGASGFLAHVFQHEMDHLNGILYTDKANEIYDDEREEKE
jgi:peptide deformylase